mgnify:CR=1 FL=1
MSNRNDKEWLIDINEAIERVMEYTSKLKDSDFFDDKKTQDAVVRNLEIIGEASGKISEDLRSANPNIPWKTLSGVRNRLIHHYFGVNIDIVWSIAKEDLPELHKNILRLTKELL